MRVLVTLFACFDGIACPCSLLKVSVHVKSQDYLRGSCWMHAWIALPGCSMLFTEKVCPCEVPGQPEGMMVGCKGSVTLDARFDAGYFCTVKVGRLEFKGTPWL